MILNFNRAPEVNDMSKHCKSCKHCLTTEGDFVPYGSTFVQLPNSYECTHEEAEELSLDEYVALLELGDSGDCHLYEEALQGDEFVW